MRDLCEPAVEVQALEMSHSLLLAGPAVTCHAWLGFRLWTLTVHPRSHIPPKCRLVGCAGKELGRPPADQQQTVPVRAVAREIWCCALFWVRAAEMAEIRDWTLLKLRTGTFRNYWAWVRLFIGKKETQHLADRWGVGPFSQVGSSGSSFCSDFLWMKLQNQYSETKMSGVTQRLNNSRRPWSALGLLWLISVCLVLKRKGWGFPLPSLLAVSLVRLIRYRFPHLIG